MPDLRTFHYRETRPPTMAEAQRRSRLEEAGLLDVYANPEAVPELWPILLRATHQWIASERATEFWERWEGEFLWATGFPDFSAGAYQSYKMILLDGEVRVGGEWAQISFAQRLSAFEHALDVETYDEDLIPAVNERLRNFRLPLKLQENGRFINVTSEHLHEEIIQPTFLLLAEERFESIDALYRKAWDRYLGSDYSGAITNVTSAIEEMLRLGGATGSNLPQLISSARNLNWFTSGPDQLINKVHAFREDSDAHAAGTDDPEVSMLFLRVGGSLLHFLGKTIP